MLRLSLALGTIFLTFSFSWAQQAPSQLQELRKELEIRYTAAQERVRLFRAHEGGRYQADSLWIIDIQPNGKPLYRVTLNVGAAITTGAAQLHTPEISGLQLWGEGMVIGVWDDGLVANHVELGERLLSRQGSILKDHATHVTGTLIASGINAQAKGMAPAAKAFTYHFGNDEAVMAALAQSDESSLLFSNHSYGTATGWQRVAGGWDWQGDLTISSEEDYRFGFYGEQAKTLDEIAFLAPYYAMFWAVGNDRADTGDGTRPRDCNAGTGYDCILPDAVAKNIFTIGAVNKVIDYLAPGSVVMSSYSSWGPTDDGRIKPDLVGAGTDLFSLSATGENTYTTLGGTSMATPNVAGSLLLVQELYGKLHGGRRMKSATLKALAIHTAKEAGPFPGPDYSYGWGLADAAAAALFLLKENGTSHRVQEHTLQNGQAKEFVFTAAPGKVVVSMAWTDPPGNPVKPSLDPLTPMLVNDLDIRLIDADGGEQRPWVLDPINPSRQAVRGDNFRDNVEKIEWLATDTKTYRLVVSHKGQLVGDAQTFGLVLSYQAVDGEKNYYWVGGSGNWTDESHWSLSTGGEPAGSIPGANDRVIFDENAVDAYGQTLITVNSNVEVKSFRWICSQPAQIEMPGGSLTVHSDWSFSSPHTVFQNSRIVFQSQTEGEVNFSTPATQDAELVFAGGHWRWHGNLDAKTLALDGGALTLRGAEIKLKMMQSVSGEQRELDMTGSDVSVTERLEINGENLTLVTDNTLLKTEGTAPLMVTHQITWNGTVVSVGATELQGSGRWNKWEARDALQINGDFEMNELTVLPGQTLTLANNRTLQVGLLQLPATAEHPVSLLGGEQSAIQFVDRDKICFDYLNINGVGVTGSAVVNAGTNSQLTNAPGWKQLPCDDLLFADFKTDFTCVGGMAALYDHSSGNPDQWRWQVTSGTNSAVASLPQMAYRLSEQAPVEVQLEIQRGDEKDRVIRTITPRPNSLAENEVLQNGEQLFSLQQAEHYQWYYNNQIVANATGRTFSFDGQEGSYFVITYNEECSRISKEFVITSVEKPKPGKVYPNPASDYFSIAGQEVEAVQVLDQLGREILKTGTQQVDVRSLPAGLYWVKYHAQQHTYIQPLVVVR